MGFRIFLSIAKWIFGILSVLWLLAFILNIYVNVIDYNYSESSFTCKDFIISSSKNYHKTGYDVPVSLSISYVDTILQAYGELNKEFKEDYEERFIGPPDKKQHWYSSWGGSVRYGLQSLQGRFDTLYVIDTIISGAEFYQNNQNVINRDRPVGNLNFNMSNFTLIDNAIIQVFPLRKNDVILLYTRQNLYWLFYIMLFISIFYILKLLSHDFSLTKRIITLCYTVSLLCLGYALLQYGFNFICAQFFNAGSIKSSSTYLNHHSEAAQIFFYSNVPFPYMYFMSGLLILILVKLLRKSQEIEYNWSLTI